MIHKKSVQIVVVIFLFLIFGGWGDVGHEIINKNAPLFFPSEISFLQSWSVQLGQHASDADYRKSSDANFPESYNEELIDRSLLIYDVFLIPVKFYQAVSKEGICHAEPCTDENQY